MLKYILPLVLATLGPAALAECPEGAVKGHYASLWTYAEGDSISADVFLLSQDFQKKQIELLFKSKTVKNWLEAQAESLKKEEKTLMVKGYGCGAQTAGGKNICEVVFVLFDLNAGDGTPQPVFARLTAYVNLSNSSVTGIEFLKK